MKYVITGGAGNISKPLALQLLEAGHEVTVIGRNADNLKQLTDAGAKAAIGSVEDPDFLVQAFNGADAVYTMVPPNWNPAGWKNWIGQIGQHYADAIRVNNVKYVVNLSSIGAHAPDGCGPVSGLHQSEQALNASGAHVKHLRPGYFFNNFLGNIEMVKNMNIIGSNFGGTDFSLTMSAPDDIALAAAEELLNPVFSGQSVRYLYSDKRTTDEIAAALGKAIGKPELPWVAFSDEAAHGGLLQAGLPEEVAANYVEMGKAIRTGIMQEDIQKNWPAAAGKTKLEDFADVFASIYLAS